MVASLSTVRPAQTELIRKVHDMAVVSLNEMDGTLKVSTLCEIADLTATLTPPPEANDEVAV
jgi:hypothetical protein